MSAYFARLPATACALLLSLFLLPAAIGQEVLYQLTADVPFDFYLGNKLMPAGNYNFSSAMARSVIAASRTPSGPHAASITYDTGGGAARDRSALIFLRYGDQYFLNQVWRAGSKVGRGLPRSHPEREALFRASAPPEPVYVAAALAR